MASGRPVIAYRSGGALDTVVEHKTGLFFERQTTDDLADVIIRFEACETQFDPDAARHHARSFGRDVFRAKMKAFIDACLADVSGAPRLGSRAISFAEAAE